MSAALPPPDENLFLEVIESFVLHHSRERSGFPLPAPEGRDFGKKRRSELCSPEVWQKAARDLATLFLPKGSAGLPEPRRDFTMAECAGELRRLWLGSPRCFGFLTSGSTGKPALCIHTEAEMAQEARALMALFEGKKKVLSTVPSHHLYGFTFGLYVPFLCGLSVERTLPLSSLVVSRLSEDSAVVGVPLLWDAVVRGRETPAPNNVTLLSASAPVRRETLETLERRGFSLADIFGSSETGVIGLRRHAAEPYRLLPYFERGDESENLSRILPGGGRRTYPLMDHLRWVNDAEFLPEGRKDRAVQVGGINVYPALLESRLTALPGVAACAVRPTGTNEGRRLKAFVVLEPGADEAAVRRGLKAFCLNLQTEERPVRFDFGTEIPRNAMGKRRDW